MEINNREWTLIPSSRGTIQNKSHSNIFVYNGDTPNTADAIFVQSGCFVQFTTAQTYVKSVQDNAIIAYSAKIQGGGIGGGGSGINFDPNPPIEGVNLFTGTSVSNAKSKRDSYFSAKPEELAKYDNDSSLMIELIYPVSGDEQLELEVRIEGKWINFLGQAIGTIQLDTHSVTELRDVTNAGSGAIITTVERTEIGALRSDLTDFNTGISIKVDDLIIATDEGVFCSRNIN